MSNSKSQAKGKRGELDLVHRLGGSARRVGHSYVATPVDVQTDFAVYQIRNKTIGDSEIAYELSRLQAVAPHLNQYVAFKVKGKWYIAESLEQHEIDHGDRLTLKSSNAFSNASQFQGVRELRVKAKAEIEKEIEAFFCHACLEDKPASEASPDLRYCGFCYDFLTKEAELLDDRKSTWVPKASHRTPLEPSCKPLQQAPGVGHNYIDTQIRSGIMSTVESKKDDGKRGPKKKALPRELIKRWVGEGMGSRVIALKLYSELGIKVSYRTVQRVLSKRAHLG